MATQEKLTKSTIRTTLKDLQQRKRYKTLEEVRKDLQSELEDEGFTLDASDLERVRLIVDEEGYTGRFAIDDIIVKKLKNKKYWPVLSIVIAIITFFIAEALGGVIQYFVQKPFADSQAPATAPAAISAFFQLPDQVNGTTLTFKVTIQNQLKTEALKDLVLFASVDDVVQKIAIEQLPPEGKQSIAGKLDIKSVHKNKFSFNAYIIGARVSFKSEPIEIVKAHSIVAMSDASANEGPRQLAMAGSSKMEASCAKDKSLRAVPAPAAMKEQECLAEEPPTMESKKTQVSFNVKDGSKDIAMKAANPDVIVEDLIRKLEKLAPSAMKADGSYMMLQTLADTGNERAKKFVEEHGK
jgi:hypothetical protein